MLMVKKRFCTPELHLIKLDNIQPETDLANLSDDELLKIMQQDDYRKKPNSLVCDMELIEETLLHALEGKQLQPVMLAPVQ